MTMSPSTDRPVRRSRGHIPIPQSDRFPELEESNRL
ncbi:hypothetical protein MCA2092 [Methylococcus capsulatus str. Bath]|uniref:Uncharacterized protein n=1 Tax=Methylococcus capsulatus (strain ATCC 33009 / NCIMB 11132 / Bath) TaxID=243233 RepID=Q606C6_METCA|nr:hypothetical protein MCA2092 [Methylococcus capsulatus str. Bath]